MLHSQGTLPVFFTSRGQTRTRRRRAEKSSNGFFLLTRMKSGTCTFLREGFYIVANKLARDGDWTNVDVVCRIGEGRNSPLPLGMIHQSWTSDHADNIVPSWCQGLCSVIREELYLRIYSGRRHGPTRSSTRKILSSSNCTTTSSRCRLCFGLHVACYVYLGSCLHVKVFHLRLACHALHVSLPGAGTSGRARRPSKKPTGGEGSSAAEASCSSNVVWICGSDGTECCSEGSPFNVFGVAVPPPVPKAPLSFESLGPPSLQRNSWPP